MSLDPVFRFADRLGPAKIVHVHEPGVGLRGTLVVDNVAAGPSIGGLRMAADVSTEECFRLARAMTLKNAAAGLPHGGGKSVLYGDPRMPTEEKERLVRAMACALGDVQDYIFLGEGGDRPRRGAAARAGRHPPRRARRHGLRPALRVRGGGPAL
jgi:glutamate dehydrogenase (NAD(P)+)